MDKQIFKRIFRLYYVVNILLVSVYPIGRYVFNIFDTNRAGNIFIIIIISNN